MARGFSTVNNYGVGTTDRIASTAFVAPTLQTHSVWVYRDGAGGADTVNSQVLWNQNLDDQMQWVGSGDARNDQFSYIRTWTGSGNWYWVKPTYKTWVNFVMTYDGGDVANAPVVYYNGVSQTVNLFTAPTGTLGVDSGVYSIGNRGDGVRVWNGMIAEFAVWNRILTSAEITALASGYSPGLFPSGLLEYIPMKVTDSPVTSTVLAAPTVTGTAVQVHPGIRYQFASRVLNAEPGIFRLNG